MNFQNLRSIGALIGGIPISAPVNTDAAGLTLELLRK
jgi:hypothetical protein